MNKMKISSLFFILIFILSVMPMASFADDDGRSYTIPKATFDLYVQEDGNLKVKETLHYSFSGTYEVFIVPLILKKGKN